MDYRNVAPGKTYRITGKTYQNAAILRKIGAKFVDDSDDFESFMGAHVPKYWLLDLTSVSKSVYSAKIANSVFQLFRSGCNFSLEAK